MGAGHITNLTQLMDDVPYFLMLRTAKGNRFTPMFNEDDELQMYESVEEAKAAAERTYEGRLYGYEIYAEADSTFSKTP